jgi:hypothetical protein
VVVAVALVVVFLISAKHVYHFHPLSNPNLIPFSISKQEPPNHNAKA